MANLAPWQRLPAAAIWLILSYFFFLFLYFIFSTNGLVIFLFMIVAPINIWLIFIQSKKARLLGAAFLSYCIFNWLKIAITSQLEMGFNMAIAAIYILVGLLVALFVFFVFGKETKAFLIH